MSSILKALKKLKEEKANQSEGSGQIEHDILRSSGKTRRADNLILPIAVVALLLTGSMLAYFLFGGLEEEQKEAVVVENTEAATTQKNQPTMAEEAQADLRAQIAAEQTKDKETNPTGEKETALSKLARGEGENLAPIAGEPREITKEPVKASQPATAKKLSEQPSSAAGTEEVTWKNREASAALKQASKAFKETAEALRKKVVFTREVAVMTRDQGSVPTSADVVSDRSEPAPDSEENIQGEGGITANRPEIKAPNDAQFEQQPAVTGNVLTRSPSANSEFPELTVSEIYYKYDINDRMAIVNDLPVMEGTLIEGARVDRIFKDRVRFVYSGRYHEVKVE